MTTTTSQPARHPKWDAFVRNFKQSNYITDFWNWFMTLMSKAAEMVLFGTVLYSGYQLLPAVPHVPAPIDAAIFVIQQGALDIGGMGLLKLAKRAKLDRNSFPVRLGASLVLLMILNVALASIKHTLPMIPGGVFVSIETLLLIARAIAAVLYGHAIHALREEYGESAITLKEAGELQERIESVSKELGRVQQEMQQRLEQQAHVFATRQEAVRLSLHEELHTALASLTPDRLMDSLIGHIETLVHERLTVSLSQMRPVTVSPVSHETPETVSDETNHLRLLAAPSAVRHRVKPASHAGTSEHQARIYARLDEDRTRKPAELQRLTGIPKATVYRLVERYQREHGETETTGRNETATNETMRHETETAS